jgi:hypothetical protein
MISKTKNVRSVYLDENNNLRVDYTCKNNKEVRSLSYTYIKRIKRIPPALQRDIAGSISSKHWSHLIGVFQKILN